jgi:HK97 family phage major capsid protein
MNTNELRRERKKIVDAAREVHDHAEKENRNMTAEEDAKYNELMNKQAEFQARIERAEKQEALDKTLAAGIDPDAQPATPPATSKSRIQVADGRRATPEFTNAFQKLLAGRSLTADDRQILNALQADNDEAGGYTVVPEQFVNMLIKAIDDVLYIRQRATVLPVDKAESLGAPSLDADPEDGTWSGEIVTVDEDTQMDFGKRILTPNLCSKLVKISKKLVRVSALNIVELVIQRLAYKFGVTMEKAYLTGTGTGQPLGVFTASANGIPTSRDVSTDNTTTAMTFDGLMNAKYSLKAGYWRNADWIFHRDGVKQIAKLKDGDGQYMWRESVRAGEPDTLMGRPVLMSEHAPNTFTTGLYVGILGDFSYYWIADAMDLSVQVLLELYAATHQNGYIARYEGDGMPVLGEAFARVKLG